MNPLIEVEKLGQSIWYDNIRRALIDSGDLAQKIGAKSPGTSVQLEVLRDGKSQTFTVALGEMSNQQQAEADTGQQQRSARLGLSLAPSSDYDGVVVTGVDPNGPRPSGASKPAT